MSTDSLHVTGLEATIVQQGYACWADNGWLVYSLDSFADFDNFLINKTFIVFCPTGLFLDHHISSCSLFECLGCRNNMLLVFLCFLRYLTKDFTLNLSVPVANIIPLFPPSHRVNFKFINLQLCERFLTTSAEIFHTYFNDKIWQNFESKMCLLAIFWNWKFSFLTLYGRLHQSPTSCLVVFFFKTSCTV